MRDAPASQLFNDDRRPLHPQLLLDDPSRSRQVRPKLLEDIVHKVARLARASPGGRADLGSDGTDELEVLGAALDEDCGELRGEGRDEGGEGGEGGGDDVCV